MTGQRPGQPSRVCDQQPGQQQPQPWPVARAAAAQHAYKGSRRSRRMGPATRGPREPTPRPQACLLLNLSPSRGCTDLKPPYPPLWDPYGTSPQIWGIYRLFCLVHFVLSRLLFDLCQFCQLHFACLFLLASFPLRGVSPPRGRGVSGALQCQRHRISLGLAYRRVVSGTSSSLTDGPWRSMVASLVTHG